MKTLLVVNADRSHSMQPTLRGMAKLGGKIIDIAAWWSETKDGTRDYYSLKYQDSVAAKEAWAQGQVAGRADGSFQALSVQTAQ